MHIFLTLHWQIFKIDEFQKDYETFHLVSAFLFSTSNVMFLRSKKSSSVKLHALLYIALSK